MNDSKKLIITITAVALVALIAITCVIRAITADLDPSPVTPAKILTKQQLINHQEEIQHAQQLKELQAWIDRHKECKK